MAADVTYHVDCATCGSLQPIETHVTERHPDGTAAAWEHRCATCGAVCGFGMDGGTLDLTTIQAPPDPAITIYTDPPWHG